MLKQRWWWKKWTLLLNQYSGRKGRNREREREGPREEETEPVSVFDMPTNLAFLTQNIKYFISPEMTIDYIMPRINMYTPHRLKGTLTQMHVDRLPHLFDKPSYRSELETLTCQRWRPGFWFQLDFPLVFKVSYELWFMQGMNSNKNVICPFMLYDNWQEENWKEGRKKER